LDQLLQYAIHRCRGIDRFANEEKNPFYQSQHVPRLQRAILAWSAIIRDGTNPTAVQEARDRVLELKATLEQAMQEDKDTDTKEADRDGGDGDGNVPVAQTPQ
jgi:hypothetical protein